MNMESILLLVKEKLSYTQAKDQIAKLDDRQENEFYIASDVYSYGRAEVVIKHLFAKPFMMKIPAGYDCVGWQ